jgi:Tfp pilus assembly protein PilX
MLKTVSILKNEEGSLLVMTIMFLALLTIVSLAASNVSITEVQIATSELIYQRNFYQAEAAVMEAAERLENLADPQATPPAWLKTVAGGITEANLDSAWAGADPDVSPAASSTDSANSRAMNAPTVHEYAIYGRCNDRGVSEIRVGIHKAF